MASTPTATRSCFVPRGERKEESPHGRTFQPAKHSPVTHQTCGTRGGPGHRGPDGKCVGWAELGRKCGSPPSLRCTPELAQPEAPAAAQRGRDIQKFKDDAHERAMRN